MREVGNVIYESNKLVEIKEAFGTGEKVERERE